MSRLMWKAYARLLQFEFCLRDGKFDRLYGKVRDFPVRGAPSAVDIEKLCRAMDAAAIWYPKRVLCLQRSAATVCMLRTYGFPAQMVLGAQQLPFKAHAWVEVHGRVVGERSHVPELYAVLDRC